MTGLVRIAGLATRRVLDFLLPPGCLACGALVSDPHALCAACWEGMRFLSPPCCACCGYPFDGVTGRRGETQGEVLCAACLAHRPAYRRARAAVAYDAASRPLILRFKHADATHAAPGLGRWLARAGEELRHDCELVTPVPLNRVRLFARRYNQSALLARALARAWERPHIPDVLVRARRTPPQGGLTREGRRRNVRGAFRLARPEVVAGRAVLLVDDVMTTGATVEECARVLLQGGARAVDVLTVARVVKGQVPHASFS